MFLILKMGLRTLVASSTNFHLMSKIEERWHVYPWHSFSQGIHFQGSGILFHLALIQPVQFLSVSLNL